MHMNDVCSMCARCYLFWIWASAEAEAAAASEFMAQETCYFNVLFAIWRSEIVPADDCLTKSRVQSAVQIRPCKQYNK